MTVAEIVHSYSLTTFCRGPTANWIQLSNYILNWDLDSTTSSISALTVCKTMLFLFPCESTSMGSRFCYVLHQVWDLQGGLEIPHYLSKNTQLKLQLPRLILCTFCNPSNRRCILRVCGNMYMQSSCMRCQGCENYLSSTNLTWSLNMFECQYPSWGTIKPGLGIRSLHAKTPPHGSKHVALGGHTRHVEPIGSRLYWPTAQLMHKSLVPGSRNSFSWHGRTATDVCRVGIEWKTEEVGNKRIILADE